jgi:hypothetical protein
MSLPPTVIGTPNAVVQPQPGMILSVACVITPPATAYLTTAAGGRSTVSVAVQPGMAVRAICTVNSAGHITTWL